MNLHPLRVVGVSHVRAHDRHTSTGGIIALALAAGKRPQEVTALYAQDAGTIFSTPFWRRLQAGLLISKYPNDGLRQALALVLGTSKLEDLKAHTVLVPSLDLDSEATNEPRSWKAKFFHNLPNEDSDGKELAVEVGLRTAAAPTYFPTVDNYIDGGVVANNPAMAALALAVNPDTTKGAGRSLFQVRMLSLGTGRNCKWVVGDHDWGVVQWGKKLIDILIEGTMGVAREAVSAPRRRTRGKESVTPSEVVRRRFDRYTLSRERAAPWTRRSRDTSVRLQRGHVVLPRSVFACSRRCADGARDRSDGRCPLRWRCMARPRAGLLGSIEGRKKASSWQNAAYRSYGPTQRMFEGYRRAS